MTYSLFFGPIPRYTIGILCLSIGLIGFYGGESKININKKFFNGANNFINSNASKSKFLYWLF